MLVSDLMSTPVHAAKPGDTVSYARNLMLRHKISRVLVVQAEKPSHHGGLTERSSDGVTAARG